jgi:hypothetical protein
MEYVVLKNEQVAENCYRLSLDISRDNHRPIPGQFYNIRCNGKTDPLLRRPFSMHRFTQENGVPCVQILYRVLGKGTERLSARKKGETLDMLGPLGNGFLLEARTDVDAEDRERRVTRPSIDEVEEKPDGSHLTELWQRRMPFYPKSRPDLLRRFVLDALKVWNDVEAGHRAVNAYHMEERVPLIKAPTLVLAGTDDPFSYPRMEPLSEHIHGSKTAEIRGGMVPMVDQMPEEFAKAVMDFLDSPQRH